MSKFIIFGNSRYNTLGVIRCMYEKKIPVFLLLVTKSRYDAMLLSIGVTEYKIVPDEKSGVEFLLKSKNAWRGATILPTSDKAESALDNYFDQLHTFYIFPNAEKQGKVNFYMDKNIQVKIAAKAGLYTPATFAYSKNTELPHDIIYPCIVKPQKSISGTKNILRVCHNERELRSAIEKERQTCDFLIQQYIDKQYDLLLIGCRFRNGETWCPGIFKKERWYLNGSDGSFGIISTDVEKYFSQMGEAEEFLRALDYHGPFSIEFGVFDNKPYFYEINLRNDGTSHYFHKAGIYIPYIYYLSNNDLLENRDLDICSKNYTFIDEFGDIINLTKSHLSFRQWLYDIRHACAYKYFEHYDIKPFLAIAPRRILSSIYKMLK